MACCQVLDSGLRTLLSPMENLFTLAPASFVSKMTQLIICSFQWLNHFFKYIKQMKELC
jgi:hypothetical protein